MRHDKLEQQLRLILLLVEGRPYTVTELCNRLGTSQRNLYYYLSFLREAGFVLIKTGTTYRLDRTSPFIAKLRQSVEFTHDEAAYLLRLLEQVEGNNPMVKNLAQKLNRFYDLHIYTDVKLQSKMADIIATIRKAIVEKHVVKIVGYSSPHSLTLTDRFVEPFLFLNDNREVRCYEMSSATNKTFKISRMEGVEIVNALWSHEDRHKQSFTDAFRFSGEERHLVMLKLGNLSCHLLQEEYPDAMPYLTRQADGTGILRIEVCSFLGIGRFVMGLYEDIEVLEGAEFMAFLKEKIKRMQRSVK